MSELSRQSDVPIATIKYYQREQLLPPGERSASNQTEYDDTHVERLRLVRALIDVGGLSVAAVQAVIAALDSDVDLRHVFEVAQHVVSPEIDPTSIRPETFNRVDEWTVGWRVSPSNPGRLAAARVLETYESIGQADERGWFARYAELALAAAEADIDELEIRQGRNAQAELVVIGTVLGDALFSGLRRAAQEHITNDRFSPGSES